MIQLAKLIKPEVLYDSQHESGAIGALWKRHHEEFCDFIDEFGSRNILEIGSGHGHFGERVCGDTRARAAGLWSEPNLPEGLVNGHHSDDIRPVEAWFGENFDLPVGSPKIDAVCHRHTLEHMYDYDEFLRTVARLSPQFQIFSVPHQVEWLRRGWQNSIMFEHPQLLTPKSSSIS